ncbi:unnamed protein product [Auanema sp. JU1783]|nr:unnamed protein product [Auanema sp. JU1783]
MVKALLFIKVQQEEHVNRFIIDDISPYTLKPVFDIKNITGFLIDEVNLNCDGIKQKSPDAMANATAFSYPYKALEQQIFDSKDQCGLIKQLFEFREKPLSKEEEEFPLAYGILVFRRPSQNEYCLAVSANAKPRFKTVMKSLGDCFPNIHVLDRPVIHWGKFEIINSTYACMEEVYRKAKRPWKYFQYLAGVDAPLKSNYEMVQIFKALNGTVNTEIKYFQPARLLEKKIEDAPIKLWKSSLSALIPYEAAKTIVESSLSRKVLNFIDGTYVPDESFWGSMTGNPGIFPVAGSVNSSGWLRFLTRRKTYLKKVRNETEAEGRMRSYLSRYQIWNENCEGKLVSGSCVFGSAHLGRLLTQPQLVAHKFNIEYQPAVYFCVLKEIRNRSLKAISTVDVKKYQQIPQVELQNGVAFENLTHPEWML